MLTQKHLETLQGSVPLTTSRKVDLNRKHLESLREEGLDLVGVDHVGSDNDWVHSPSDSFERVNERRWLGLFSGGETKQSFETDQAKGGVRRSKAL